MTTPLLLMISDDAQRVAMIREHLHVLVAWDVAVESTGELEREPFSLLNADVVLIDLEGLDDRDRGKAFVTKCREAFRPVAVVALSERYIEEEAIAYIQDNGSDYLSLVDHADRIAHVISTLAIESVRFEAPTPSSGNRTQTDTSTFASFRTSR